jgi:hypothetical protein
MTDQTEAQRQELTAESVVLERRIFMRSLGKWSQAVIAGALVGGTLFDPRPAAGGGWYNRYYSSGKTSSGKTQHRTIEEFLAAQGSQNGNTGDDLFVPPDPNFLGWNSELDKSPVYFAGVDYAGLAHAWAPLPTPPEMTGTVTERALSDGTAEVTVLLHTKNANAWVIDLDLDGDLLNQIANKSTLFGHRPEDVRDGEEAALGDVFLHIVFINTAPGDPLPDLMDVVYPPAQPPYFKSIGFQMNAKGPLTEAFGVPEGTPGMCKIAQTGLLATQGKGRALEDSFPAESIILHTVGQ